MIFLRPELLLLLLPWLALCIWLFKQQTHRSAWSQVIAPELLQALDENPTVARSKTTGRMAVMGTLFILALSSPAIERTDAQSVSQGNLYVLLDTSLSMAGTDHAPDRLTRAKRMIDDWVNSGLFAQTSVIAYSASAHVITPLTSDAETLNTQLQPLTPFLMPEFGNRADLAFSLLNETLSRSNDTHGHILWLTDDIAANQTATIKDSLPSASSLTLVALGTETGSPIPLPNNQGYLMQGNSMVVVATDFQNIANRGHSLGFNLTPLGALPSANLFDAASRSTTEYSGYKDIGYWLLLPLAVLVLMQLRLSSSHARASLLTVLFMVGLTPNPSDALDLFQNNNQQAYQALINQQADIAATLAKDNAIKAEALFQSGHYPESAQRFSELNTQVGYYNQGNALAFAGQLEEALTAYERSLSFGEHPEARKNKTLIEQYLKNQSKEEPSTESDAHSESESQQPSPDQNQPGSQRGASQQNSSEALQPSDDTPSETQPSASTEESASDSEPLNQPTENAEPGSDKQGKPPRLAVEAMRTEQQTESIFNQLESQPGAVLQQKLKFQYLKNPTQADETLW